MAASYLIFGNDDNMPKAKAVFPGNNAARAAADRQYGNNHSLFKEYMGVDFMSNPTAVVPEFEGNTNTKDYIFEGSSRVYKGLSVPEAEATRTRLGASRMFEAPAVTSYGSLAGEKLADVVKMDANDMVIAYGQFTRAALVQERAALEPGEKIYMKQHA